MVVIREMVVNVCVCVSVRVVLFGIEMRLRVCVKERELCLDNVSLLFSLCLSVLLSLFLTQTHTHTYDTVKILNIQPSAQHTMEIRHPFLPTLKRNYTSDTDTRTSFIYKRLKHCFRLHTKDTHSYTHILIQLTHTHT
jgi:hypothetical protein